jgi:urease accessory protein
MLVGGDDVSVDVSAGPGAVLVLRDISGTLAHPMGDDGPGARQVLHVRVADGGRVVIAEEPLVIAAAARLRREVRIALDGDARVLHRDTLVLGRHGERGGAVVAHTRVERDGRAVLDDTFDSTIGEAALRSAAVLGGARVLATLALFAPDDLGGRPTDAFELAQGDALVRRLARRANDLGDLGEWQRTWHGRLVTAP